MNPWRLPKNCGLAFWLICTVLVGVFIDGQGLYLILTYLALSALFWVASFFYIRSHPLPSLAARLLLAFGPLGIFMATVYGCFMIWSR